MFQASGVTSFATVAQDDTKAVWAPHDGNNTGQRNQMTFYELTSCNSNPIFTELVVPIGHRVHIFVLVDSFSWAGKGSSVFAKTPPRKEDANDDIDVEQEVDVHFEPIVPLPDLVDVKTGAPINPLLLRLSFISVVFEELLKSFSDNIVLVGVTFLQLCGLFR